MRGGVFYWTSYLFNPDGKELTIDCRSSHRNRSRLTSSQIEGEVVCIPFVHHFKAQISAVEHISPSIDHITLAINNRVVEVETIQVERHRGDTQ
jgi:hypothetical protein